MSDLLSMLNEQQQRAVSAPNAHRLVLAGAGSGKTRVLVHRIAWLMEEQSVSPFSLLAVTFTNKAANEMRARIEELCQFPLKGVWIGTFHGLANRLLRRHAEAAGLPASFQILDADDQQRLIKRAIRSLEIDETKFPPKQAQFFINKCKENAQRPNTQLTNDYYQQVMHKIYSYYQEICEQSGLVDFSELLLRALELLQNNEDIREHYQQRFQHLLVDEFQDTNPIQYQWLKTLCNEQTCVMAVGDDDQSIYSWRGAKVEHIEKFTHDFHDCEIIRLEQNYRSTQTILDAANAVIAQNQSRLGKNLWTDTSKGNLITTYAAFSEQDESYFIANTIKQLTEQDNRYDEIAILYRANAQSRVIEERLLQANIPYRIYGGQRFFERAEIKDALAYLRLLINPHDDAAFERVVNLPTRGIGQTTLNTLRTGAREQGQSLWLSCTQLIANQSLTARASTALQAFLDLVIQLQDMTASLELDSICETTLQMCGLMDHYKKDRSEKGLSRVENLHELITAMSQFRDDENTAEHSPLTVFLAHVSLEAGETQADPNSNSVSLMTLHAAKGLEFPIVFLTGLEENLFPHQMSMDSAAGLEEERRLCYVGITRAMRSLYLTHAESRRLHGTDRYHLPSRFLKEIPPELINELRPKARVSRPQQYRHKPYSSTPYSNASTSSQTGLKGAAVADTNFTIGQAVRHPKFGDGMVINYEGSGVQTRIQVKFNEVGAKWLVLNYCRLESM